MSFELQKIVNQLQIITKSLDFMDRNVSEHERVIEKLTSSEKVDVIMADIEDKGLMTSQIYNSAWEAQNRLEGQEPVQLVDEGEEDLPLQMDEY